MEKPETIYITGHRHPDTDSIVSAIAYAFFKRANGIQATPARLGQINNETEYLLKRFHFDTPVLLTDARKTIAEIEIDDPDYITPETTVLDAVMHMHKTGRSSFAVLNEDHTIAGFVSKSDLANIGLGDTAAEIELLKHTSPNHIASAINGKIVYADHALHINGKVSIVAHSAKGIENYDVEDRIVIIGDDPKAQKNLIQKGAGILIAVWTDAIEDDVIATAKQYHCPIILSGHGSMNTSRYLFLAPPVKLIMRKPIVFKDTLLVEEASRKMSQTKYRSYPVIHEDGTLAGYISRYHVLNHKEKKIILVDHNEFSQSVHSIEKAQILEVIDHHRINDFATSQPVSFRNEIVGSTATIITTMFRENQIPMTENMAGLLLGAVLSDTLLLQSPTTTEKDHTVARILAAVANLDIETFGKEMFSASAFSDRSIHDMIVSDIKYFEIDENHVMISQVLVPSALEMRKQSKEIEMEMNLLTEKKNLDLLVVAFTSIIENGSVFYATGELSEKAMEAFKDTNEPHALQKDILSRKMQILPKLTAVLEEN